MTTFAYHMAEAINAANDDLEALIDRITYNRPHLFLRDESIFAGITADIPRPFAICDAANGGVTVARFDSREWAEKFARGHARLHGSTLDYESFSRTEEDE